jgi:glucose/arabinose dehydrogenase|tara:strand:- start:2599 stop:3732 length:1134 start_codon:yes stop_codon:yes gene_type:complete
MKKIALTFILLITMGQSYGHEDKFLIEEVASFDQPWSMAFLPDGNFLVTEKPGKMFLMNQAGETLSEISGVPEVAYGGQGGLGDVAIHPDFNENKTVYVSFAEEGKNDTRGAVVIKATLDLTEEGGALTNLEYIWRQVPKVTGRGHYAHRMAFSEDGYLFISSGDRQKFDPAQDMTSNMGKIIRLNDDGSIPTDNPFYNDGGVAAEVWSLGHRNPLGIDFDADGKLWNIEMGPRGGDELNLVLKGEDYGYPTVSNGIHYNGSNIPNHDTRPEFEEPKEWWGDGYSIPVISPSSFVIYQGDLFYDWQGSGFISGLSSESLIRVQFDGDSAKEIERFDMGRRIRSVEEGPDGALWLLEDYPRRQDTSKGRLLRLTPHSH